MHNYNTDCLVKYKEIEEELLDKIRLGEEDYTTEDVYLISEELYRHELLMVFQVSTISDPRVNDIFTELWIKMKKCSSFLTVLDYYTEKVAYLHSWNFRQKTEDIFVGMFNYSFFHILHKCIVQYLETNHISEKLLLEMKQIIDEL